MPWPTTLAVTTNLDNGAVDSPALARPDLKAALDLLNAAIESRGEANGVCGLGADAKIDPDNLPTIPLELLPEGAPNPQEGNEWYWLNAPTNTMGLRVNTVGNRFELTMGSNVLSLEFTSTAWEVKINGAPAGGGSV